MAKTKRAEKTKGEKPEVDPQTAELLKRLKEIGRLGRLIEGKKAEVSSQETTVGKRKSDLDDERETLSELNAELRGLQDDLDKIAVGKFSERLSFPDVAATTPTGHATGTQPVAQPDDAWKAVQIETLLKGAKPNVLAKLTDDGITTFGKLEEWRASGKKIAGLGEAAIQFIDDARVKYFEDHPQPKPEPKEQHTAAGDKPGDASRGAGVQRAKLELAELIDERLKFADVKTSEANEIKLLTAAVGRPVELTTATIDQLSGWIADVKNASDGFIKQLFAKSELAAAAG